MSVYDDENGGKKKNISQATPCFIFILRSTPTPVLFYYLQPRRRGASRKLQSFPRKACGNLVGRGGRPEAYQFPSRLPRILQWIPKTRVELVDD